MWVLHLKLTPLIGSAATCAMTEEGEKPGEANDTVPAADGTSVDVTPVAATGNAPIDKAHGASNEGTIEGVAGTKPADIAEGVREEIETAATETPLPVPPGAVSVDGQAEVSTLRKHSPGEPDIVMRKSVVLEAVAREIRRQGLPIETPDLIDGSQHQRKFRVEHFNDETLNTIQLFQNLEAFSSIVDGKGWYDFVSTGPGAYVGGKVLLENAAILTLPPKYRSIEYLLARFEKMPDGTHEPLKDQDGKLEQANIVELGPGNGDFIIRIKKLAAASKLPDEVGNMVEKKGTVIKDNLRELLKLYRTEIINIVESGEINDYVSGIDYVLTFVSKLRSKRKINAMCADLCDPSEKFLKDINLPPNSQDLMAMILVVDRLGKKGVQQPLEQAIENMRYLARLDDTTRFLIGISLPFEPVSDIDSKNPNIKKISFWEKSGDIRQRYMADIEVENEELKKLDLKQAVRAQAMHNAIMDLNRLGLVVETLAEQPYEVYSPHCIIEPAGVIRRDYQYLENMQFNDPALQRMNDEIFSEPEKYPDDKLVGYPQIYDGEKALVLFGGRVLAKDGSKFRQEDGG